MTIFKMYGFPLGVRLSLYSGVPYRAPGVHGTRLYRIPRRREASPGHMPGQLFSAESLVFRVFRLIWDVPVVK